MNHHGHETPAAPLLRREGNTVILEIPRDRLGGGVRSSSSWSYAVTNGLPWILLTSVVLYLLSPVYLFLMDAIFDHSNASLESIVYEAVPLLAAKALLAYIGVVVAFVGIQCQRHLSVHSPPP